MGTNALILGLAIATLRVVGSAPSAALSKDPCALLKTAEIQALTPKAQVGAGVSNIASAALGSVVCEYKWGTGANSMSGLYNLNVTLSDASKTFPGMSSAMIKEGILSIARTGGANAAVIPGVGEAAVFTSNSPIQASTTAYVKGVILGVDLGGPDARAKKDQVIVLLKTAAARL